MTTQVQIRGAATATQAARTLAARELDIDTTLKRLNVHDSTTVGGTPHARWQDIQNQEWKCGNASGTNSITVTLTKSPGTYQAFQKFTWKAANNNTGSATINFNSVGAKTLKKLVGGVLVTLDADDIVAGMIYECTYDGTDMLFLGAIGGTAATENKGIIIHDGFMAGGSSVEDFTWATDAYRSIEVIAQDLAMTGTGTGADSFWVQLFSGGSPYAGASYQNATENQTSASGTSAPVYNQTTATQWTIADVVSASSGVGYSGHLYIDNVVGYPMLNAWYNHGNAATAGMSRNAGCCNANFAGSSAGIRFGITTAGPSRQFSNTGKLKIIGYP